MDRILFLDFDGVLTSESHTRQCIFEYRRENLYGMDWFDPACLEHLKAIVDATGAGIVVSSSWRELGGEKLRRVWEEIPMPGELLGTTPVWVLTKKEAIQEYLKSHPDAQYVILDDEDLGLPNQVKIDARCGLSEKDALKATEILNFV